MKYQNIIFDLDGTLTDSGEGIMNGTRYALETLNIPIPDLPLLRTVVGPPLSDSFRRFGVPEAQIEEAVRLYRVRYVQQGGMFENSVYPGVEEMLLHLKEAGKHLYVGTSKPEKMARQILQHFGLDEYFDYIAGATLDNSRNSKAKVLEYLLKESGLEGQAVMVGDTEFDVEGAHELGIPCLGVTWGYGLRSSMEAAKAEAIAEDTAQLTALLMETEKHV